MGRSVKRQEELRAFRSLATVEMETMGSCSKCRFLASTLLCFYSILESEFPGCENWATTLTLQQAPLGDFSVCCAAGCDLQIEAMRLVVRGFLRAALV